MHELMMTSNDTQDIHSKEAITLKERRQRISQEDDTQERNGIHRFVVNVHLIDEPHRSTTEQITH